MSNCDYCHPVIYNPLVTQLGDTNFHIQFDPNLNSMHVIDIKFYVSRDSK